MRGGMIEKEGCGPLFFCIDTGLVSLYSQCNQSFTSDMQKKLLILVVVALILIGGVFLIFGKKSGAINQSKTEDLRIVPMSEKEKADNYAWNWDGDK